MRRAQIAAVAVVAAVTAGGCRSLPPAPPCDCATVLAAEGPSCPPLDLGAVAGAAPAGRWRNLAFEGGGVKGVAYAGALQTLGAAGGLDGVDRIAGTSAGSITALVVALGYTPEEVTRIVLDLDFDEFRDGTFLTDAERLFEQYGWHPAFAATCLFECLVEQRLGDRRATFADLHARAEADPAFRDLYVVSTDLDRGDWVVFSHEDPRWADLPLADAVRASMAIPFYFTAQEIAGDVFVDGGVLMNYPIGLFDQREDAGETLGFYLGGLPDAKPVDDFVAYTEQVFASLLAVQTDDVCADPDDVRRSVFIDPLGIATTDFGLTREQKCALIESGAKATREYLRQPSTECPERMRSERSAGG
ncbi:MAG TPA: patatin-like phospholipase family protein [Thermoanaerobaculia bacterium]|nr:patatin-like phospholipase family protein [Thermoanaerobaculia bacterium]